MSTDECEHLVIGYQVLAVNLPHKVAFSHRLTCLSCHVMAVLIVDTQPVSG